jgi:hypothetical protein
MTRNVVKEDESLWLKWTEYILTTGTSVHGIPKEAYDEDPAKYFKMAVRNKDPMIDKILSILDPASELVAIIKNGALELNDKMLRRLIQACHPDRNGGSQMSVEITQWLNAKRH